MVETGFRKAFKGNWGSVAHTKKVGVVQPLNRLSYNSFIAHLRKINLSIDASAKIVAPHLLHNSQWGLIDPLDTPDGGMVGLHKHLAISTVVTNSCSSSPLISWLRENNIRLLSENSPKLNGNLTKIIVNGNWIGTIDDPIKIIDKFKIRRRLSLISRFISIFWDIKNKTLEVIKEKYGFDSNVIKMFIHYAPSTYHLHIHQDFTMI